MNEYDKQAEQFLKDTNTTFKAKYIKYGLYFQDEKDKRDIYEITLKRGNRQYKFKFGQSINASQYKIKRKDGTQYLITVDTSKTLIEAKREFLKHFGNLAGLKIIEPKTPTAYDVLTCLEKYEYIDFKDFCSNFGYDVDSRKAEKIYKAVVEEHKNVCMLWNEEEINKLQEIQ